MAIDFISKVSGVTYEGRQAIIASLTGNEPTRIEPEPTNPYDPNALAVKVATADGIKHVGYVPKDLAAKIAPLLEGESLMVTIQEITGGFETWHGEIANYGLIIRIVADERFPTDIADKWRKEPESEELRKKYYAPRYPEAPEDYDLPVGDFDGD